MAAQPQEHFDVMNDTEPRKNRISKILTFIWEFHTMHPDHTYFPKRKKNVQFVFLIYSLEHGQTPGGQSLK